MVLGALWAALLELQAIRDSDGIVGCEGEDTEGDRCAGSMRLVPADFPVEGHRVLLACDCCGRVRSGEAVCDLELADLWAVFEAAGGRACLAGVP